MAHVYTDTLPDKPSELLEVALRDLEEVEKDDRYQVDMGSWHHTRNKVCNVCFAGATLAKTVGLKPKDVLDWDIVENDLRYKLEALDEFRSGDVVGALEYLDCWDNLPQSDRIYFGSLYSDPDDFIYYDYNPEKFKKQMENLITNLAKKGL